MVFLVSVEGSILNGTPQVKITGNLKWGGGNIIRVKDIKWL